MTEFNNLGNLIFKFCDVLSSRRERVFPPRTAFGVKVRSACSLGTIRRMLQNLKIALLRKV